MSNKYNLKFERGMYPEKLKNFAVKATLPGSVDLRSKINIMYDQGQLGSCTANALCYSYKLNDPTFQPSRLFLYYNERALDGDILDDAGSTLTQGINALIKYGVCSEAIWPYNIAKFTNKPPTNAFTEGLLHQVVSASRVLQTADSMKGCLYSGQPFVLGILVYSSFQTQQVANTGYVPMPNTLRERLLGGHAIICVGYNDTKKVWIMKNSWGSNWGDNGYFYLPYDYLLSKKLAGDMWKITKVEIVIENKKKYVQLKMNESIKHLQNHINYYRN